MLPWSQRHLEALVVGDLIFVVITDYGVHQIDVASEHLVEVTSLPVGLGATRNGWCEAAPCQRLTHRRDVVV